MPYAHIAASFHNQGISCGALTADPQVGGVGMDRGRMKHAAAERHPSRSCGSMNNSLSRLLPNGLLGETTTRHLLLARLAAR